MFTLYHGTTTALNINGILKPPEITNIKREDFHDRNNNCIYFTDSLLSANKYANKAVSKFGGKPVIYEVMYDENTFIELSNHEYIFIGDEIKIK